MNTYSKTILWREWLQNGGFITKLLAFWLLVLLITPVIHTGFIVAILCGLLGIVLGVRLGGSDSIEGCEAFAFALPPSRQNYFWTRFLFGLGIILACFAAGYYITEFHVSAKFWKMFFESGLADESGMELKGDWPPFAVGIALIPFITTFGVTTIARGPSASLAWLPSALIFAVPAGLVLLFLNIIERRFTDNTSNVLLTLVGVGALCAIGTFFLCYQVYLRKSTSSYSIATQRGQGRGCWIAGFLMAGVVLLLLIMTMWNLRVVKSHSEAERARMMAEQERARVELETIEAEHRAAQENINKKD